MSEELVGVCIRHDDIRHMRLYYDYMGIYKGNEHKCKIVRILETWTNSKYMVWATQAKACKEQNLPIPPFEGWVTMSHQQFSDYMYGTSKVDSIKKNLAELVEKDKHVERRVNPENPYGPPQYRLNLSLIQKLLDEHVSKGHSVLADFGMTTTDLSTPPRNITPPPGGTNTPTQGGNLPLPQGGKTPTSNNSNKNTTKNKEKENVAALADDASRSFPSSNNENDSQISTSSNQFPTNDVEKLETNSQPANSSTPLEPTAIVPENVENAPTTLNVNDSTPLPENSAEVAKPQASGKVRIAATPKKPARNTKKKALELVPVLPPARPSAETPWGVEKCLAWGDYVRKSTLPESTRKDSKSFKAKEAACKIIGRGITENSFLVIFVNWMKGLDLDLNPLTKGTLKSETWPDYSVDLWVVDEHYEDEARKYQKAKLTQSSVQTKKEEPSQADEDARREAARIKNQAAFEKVQRIKAKQEQERQAGKKRAI